MIAVRLIVIAALLSFSTSLAAADNDYWSRMAVTISAEIAKAEALALDGKPAEAKKAVVHAYFGLFESEKMEAGLRKQLGAKHAFAREKQFGDLRKLVAKGNPDEIRALSAALRAGLADDGAALDKAGVPPEVYAVNQ